MTRFVLGYGQVCIWLVVAIHFMARLALSYLLASVIWVGVSFYAIVKGNPDSFHHHVQELADNIRKMNLLQIILEDCIYYYIEDLT